MSKYEEIRFRLSFNMDDPEQEKLHNWLRQYPSTYERNRALMGILAKELSNNDSSDSGNNYDSFFNRMSSLLDEKIEQLTEELRIEKAEKVVMEKEFEDGIEQMEKNEVESEESIEISDELTDYLKSNGFM